MSADSLYDNIRSYLRLSTRIVSKVGDIINEKEKFTIRFTVSNNAYSANLVNKPRIIFLNTRIYVKGTGYAAPVGGNKWHNLPDTSLYPGESSYVDIEFIAIKDIDGWIDWFVAEHVARVWIKADLNQDKFFKIWNYSDVRQEIEPT